jgi:RNA polymerase primary sigma factor
MHTRFHKPSLTGGPARRELWYTPDRRIRTQSASRRAAEVAEWVSAGRVPETVLDELLLFAALHTCAFRVARPAGGKHRALVEREAWFRRWYDIREHIIEKNIGMVYAMLRKFTLTNQDEDDRLSDGMFALARAVERFNPWKGYRFSTYACNIIVRALMRGEKRKIRCHSLFAVQHQIPFERLPGRSDFSAELYAERLSRAIEGNLAELTILESRIIGLRFPREDDRCLTFREIGDAVGLSKERIRQIQKSALSKLRLVLESDSDLQ